MISAKITGIGNDAISEKDGLVILFDKTATPDLKKVAVIQEIRDLNHSDFNLKKGGQIKIGSDSYQIEFVGSLVNNNLKTIGHTTLVFKEVPTNPLESAVYLRSGKFPSFEVGEEIQYI